MKWNFIIILEVPAFKLPFMQNITVRQMSEQISNSPSMCVCLKSFRVNAGMLIYSHMVYSPHMQVLLLYIKYINVVLSPPLEIEPTFFT